MAIRARQARSPSVHIHGRFAARDPARLSGVIARSWRASSATRTINAGESMVTRTTPDRFGPMPTEEIAACSVAVRVLHARTGAVLTMLFVGPVLRNDHILGNE